MDKLSLDSISSDNVSSEFEVVSSAETGLKVCITLSCAKLLGTLFCMFMFLLLLCI